MSNDNSNSIQLTNCTVCSKEIPLDAIYTPEGASYVEQFCGRDCFQLFLDRKKSAEDSQN